MEVLVSGQRERDQRGLGLPLSFSTLTGCETLCVWVNLSGPQFPQRDVESQQLLLMAKCDDIFNKYSFPKYGVGIVQGRGDQLVQASDTSAWRGCHCPFSSYAHLPWLKGALAPFQAQLDSPPAQVCARWSTRGR